MKAMQFIYKTIANALQAHPTIIDRLIQRAQRTPYSHITSADGKETYMRRWWLFNPYQRADGSYVERNWFMRLLPSIRIHHILREDRDRHLHDHPWDAQTFILRGWYYEQITDDPQCIRSRDAGYTGSLLYGQYHRIAIVPREGAWTLFITFKYRGTWGFRVNGKKVPWRDYLAGDFDRDKA